MSELLEVVFERVPRSGVYQLLTTLSDNGGGILSVQCSEDIPFSINNIINKSEFERFSHLSSDAILMIKIRELRIKNIIIPSVLLRVVKYGNQFDIDFNFDEQEVEYTSTNELMKEIHAYVTNVGEIYEVGHWFGGMEPASDENTRYFTDKESGPLA